MATLPQAADYGVGPDLKTNRLDRPGNGALESAIALENATKTVISTIEARGGQRDKLHFAIAKADLVKADLLAREELDGDQDWKTQNQRYEESFKAAREKIANHFELDPGDQAILDAEGDLIATRGGIAVRSAANAERVEQARAELDRGNDEARGLLDKAKGNEDRNSIIQSRIEAINAGVEGGYIEHDEAEAMRQTITKDFATASLDAMSAADEAAAIEATLKARRGSTDPKVLGDTATGDGSITAQELMDGEGTESVADFLHGDVLAKRLKAAKTESEAEKNRIAGYEVKDKAIDLYPEDEMAARRYAAENLTGNARQVAESEIADHFSRQNAAENRVAQANQDVYGKGILAGEIRLNEIPLAAIRTLSDTQFARLQAAQDSYDSGVGQGFARVSQITDTHDGNGSIEAWNALPTYGEITDNDAWGSKAAVDLESLSWKGSLSASDYNTLLGMQEGIIADANKPIGDNGVSLSVMVKRKLDSSDFSSGDRDNIEARLELDLQQAIIAKQHEFTPPRKLTPQEEETELNILMARKAFVPDWGRDDEYDVSTLTDKQRLKAYKPLDQDRRFAIGGQDLTTEEYLTSEAVKAGIIQEGATIKQRNLERAYFYMENPESSDEDYNNEQILLRLRGD